jgi:syntaxin 16
MSSCARCLPAIPSPPPPCHQGTVLDRIDFNIEQAADRVGAAVVELNKANEYQKKSKTMMCIYLLLLLCGVMVIILILKNMLK